MRRPTLWILLLLFSMEYCYCARILGIIPVMSRSHYSITRKIMTTLASKGHQVTVISAIKEKQIIPNYTHIHFTDGLFNGIDSVSVESNNVTNIIDLMEVTDEFERNSCSLLLMQDYMKEIILSKSDAYDLIFVETYFYPCSLVLGSYLNVPVIWFVAPTSHYPIDYFTGNPNNPAYVPSITSGLSNDMSFIERLMNFYQISVIHYYQANVFVSAAVDQFNKLYNVQVTLEQVYKLPNLAFTYSHFTLFPRPNLPNVVEIGGVHIEDNKPLPQDINDFIEKAEHGAIFFSFGTTLKCSSISEKKMEMFKKVFSKIPQRILWRCDIADQVEVPDNVMIRYWFPQRDILAHKNIQAFISHGGILGVYEAIYTATPIIGIPLVFDQYNNIRLLEKKGVALLLDYPNLDAELLLTSINEIVNNSRYRENIQKLSVIFKDRPMSPLDTAIYWIEYIIRHNGASHLKSSAAEMPLYRYLLLDVIAFLVICVLLTLYLSFLTISKLFALARLRNLSQCLKEKLS